MQARRENNLWCNCDEAYTPRYKYVHRHHKVPTSRGLVTLVSYLYSLSAEPTQVHSQPAMDQLLQKYNDIFPNNPLPPNPPGDHTIPLLAEQPPSKSVLTGNPTEIEQIVAEMLAFYIIYPNNDPFSSPILSVKKNDGTLRFCLDQRKLNNSQWRTSTLSLLLMNCWMNSTV